VGILALFGKKETVLMDESFTLGEFDPTVDGAYRNVKTFQQEVRPGKRLFISVISDHPVDVALSNGDGNCIKFKDSVTKETIGPIETSKKETMALVLGIFRGDRADLSVRAWMG